MNRRKMAINIIVAEVAETGEAGRCAIRAYVETRLSRKAFGDACEIGRKIYERKLTT